MEMKTLDELLLDGARAAAVERTEEREQAHDLRREGGAPAPNAIRIEP